MNTHEEEDRREFSVKVVFESGVWLRVLSGPRQHLWAKSGKAEREGVQDANYICEQVCRSTSEQLGPLLLAALDTASKIARL